MSTPLYVQHDWGAATWATMLTGIILVVLALFTLFIVMLQRASQTVAPVTRPEPLPEPTSVDRARGSDGQRTTAA